MILSAERPEMVRTYILLLYHGTVLGDRQPLSLARYNLSANDVYFSVRWCQNFLHPKKVLSFVLQQLRLYYKATLPCLEEQKGSPSPAIFALHLYRHTIYLPSRLSCNMAQPQAYTTCDDCIKIFEDAGSILSSEPQAEPSRIPFNKSYQSRLAINRSASQCRMCTLLGASIPELLQPFGEGQKLELEMNIDKYDSAAVVLSLVSLREEKTVMRSYLMGSLRIQDSKKEPKNHDRVLRRADGVVEHGHVSVLRSPKTWSLESLNHVRSWMKTCISSHEDCAKRQAESRLPRRLIDVMATRLDHGSDMEEIGLDEFNRLSVKTLPNVRIISSDCLPPDTPYLTLSHRWGNPPSVLLTKKTMFLLTEDISHHLGRGEAAVFRHAIHVTRGLGFRYIWIDALCIMQDNQLEKMADIMQMDEIYSNSMLNISAAEGQSRDGLVFDRDIFSVNPHQATITIPKSHEVAHLQAFPDRWAIGPQDAPLNQRGWVFQERTLAPRIIHFTKDVAFWECRGLEASEILPQAVPYVSNERLTPKGVGTSFTLSMQELKLQWIEIVERYSRTSLTFADDRLLALSAVAKQFCSVMRLHPSDYLAGMWRGELPISLLWAQEMRQRISELEPTRAVTEMERAPSWSWASILGLVNYVRPISLMAVADVLDVQIARTSPNFFDGADSCRLRLRSYICKFSRRVQDGLPWVYIAEAAEFPESNDFLQRGTSIVILWDTSRGQVTEDLLIFRREPTSSVYFLLHIASERSDEWPTERGIVLRKTGMRGTFTRIGYFFTQPESKYVGSKLEGAFNGRINTLDMDDYVQLDSDGRVTIDIL